MKHINKILIVFALMLCFSAKAQQTKYKCMLQMTNYKGLEAYVVVSLIDPNGNHEKTLYMMGPDKQWYNGFKDWHKKMSKKKENLSTITSASIPAGDRSVTTFILDETIFDKGYKIRFESAVEDQNNYPKDVEIPLTKSGITQKTNGVGYIRYVKMSKI